MNIHSINDGITSGMNVLFHMLIISKFQTSLCIFVIVGVALVMQPPFIFGYEESILNQTNTDSSTNFTNVRPDNYLYFLIYRKGLYR